MPVPKVHQAELELHTWHHSSNASPLATCLSYHQVRLHRPDPQLLIMLTDAHQKIKLTGIIIVMYSPQTGPPARMYMLVADKDGVAGVTVWGDTVAQLMSTSNVIGQAVSIPNCTMSFYNNKRSLNVPRNHVVQFPESSPHLDWWSAKLQTEPVTTRQLLALPEQSIANVFAVVASIRREEKTSCKIPFTTYCAIAVLYNKCAAAFMHTRPQLTRCS